MNPLWMVGLALVGASMGSPRASRRSKASAPSRAARSLFVERVRHAVANEEAPKEKKAVERAIVFYDACRQLKGTKKNCVVAFATEYDAESGSHPKVWRIIQRYLSVPETGRFDAATKEAVARNVRMP